MKNVKTSIIGKYALSLIAIATLNCSSLSFGMNILEAIEMEDISRAKEILGENKKINLKDDYLDSKTPLSLACEKNNPKIVELLLDYSYNNLGESITQEFINTADENDDTPFHLACDNNNLEIVKLLIKYSYNNNGEFKAYESINAMNYDDNTPLHLAVNNNNPKIFKLLIDNGARKSINTTNYKGETPLYWACENNNLEMTNLLLANGAQESINKANSYDDDDGKDSFGKTALCFACENNNLEMVEVLLSNGSNVDEKSLCEAQGKSKILEALIFSQNYDKAEDKIEFINKAINDNSNNNYYRMLIKRALVKSLNEVQEDKLKSIEETLFGKIYDKLKDNVKFAYAFGIMNKENIYEYIKRAAIKENNPIYLEEGFIKKHIPTKATQLQSKTTNKKKKFTATRIISNTNTRIAESDPSKEKLKHQEKRKREEENNPDFEEENINKRRKLDQKYNK